MQDSVASAGAGISRHTRTACGAGWVYTPAPMSILILEIQAFGKVLKDNVERFAATRPHDPATLETTRTLGEALAQFVDIAEHVDSGDEAPARLTAEDMDRIGIHVLPLMEAVVEGVQDHIEPADQATLQRAVAGASVWLARAGARLEHLEPVANAFAAVANATRDPAELAALCLLMEEVLMGANAAVKAEPETSDPLRPWRLMNLNWGIMATRSHDTALMRRVFDQMAMHIPADMPAFFREGMDEMTRSDYPVHVKEVMQAYHDQWTQRTAH